MDEHPKYILTDQARMFSLHMLRRIQAVKTFDTKLRTVYEGEYGGWIESYDCLSQDDNSWVFGDAYVTKPTRICNDTIVHQ